MKPFPHHNVRAFLIATFITGLLIAALVSAAMASAETYPVAPVQFTEGSTHGRGFNVHPGTSAKLNCRRNEAVVGYDAATYNDTLMSMRTVGVFTIRQYGTAVVVFAPNGYVANIGKQTVAVEVLCKR